MKGIASHILKATLLALLLASQSVYGGLVTVTVDWTSVCGSGPAHTASDCIFSVQYDNTASSASLYSDGANGIGEFGYGDDVWIADVIAPGAVFLSQGIADLSGFYNVVESQVINENSGSTELHSLDAIDSAILTDTYSYVYEDSTGINFLFRKDSFSFEFNFQTLLGTYEVLDTAGNSALERELNLTSRSVRVTIEGEIVLSPAPGEPTPPPATIPATNPPAPPSEPEPPTEPETPAVNASSPSMTGILLLALLVTMFSRTSRNQIFQRSVVT